MKYFGTVIGVLGLDLFTKKWAVKYLLLQEKKEIIPNKFYFCHIKNSGMAYNLGEGNPKMVLKTAGLITACCMGSLIYFIKRRDSRAMPTAVLLGGALGNLLERLWKGAVTDFLYIKFKKAPIFNLADIAIVGGTLWLFGAELQSKK